MSNAFEPRRLWQSAWVLVREGLVVPTSSPPELRLTVISTLQTDVSFTAYWCCCCLPPVSPEWDPSCSSCPLSGRPVAVGTVLFIALSLTDDWSPGAIALFWENRSFWSPRLRRPRSASPAFCSFAPVSPWSVARGSIHQVARCCYKCSLSWGASFTLIHLNEKRVSVGLYLHTHTHTHARDGSSRKSCVDCSVRSVRLPLWLRYSVLDELKSFSRQGSRLLILTSVISN